jgi:hypothetical protein
LFFGLFTFSTGYVISLGFMAFDALITLYWRHFH